jgi:dienelactone hydrolase
MRSVSRLRDKSGPTGIEYGLFAALILIGALDDWTPASDCSDKVNSKEGPPIELVIYPGAYHAWTAPNLTTLRFYPEFLSTKKCPVLLLASNRPPALLIDGQAKPFEPGSLGKCMAEAPGYSMGFDEALRARSLADAVRFLQRNLQP